MPPQDLHALMYDNRYRPYHPNPNHPNPRPPSPSTLLPRTQLLLTQPTFHALYTNALQLQYIGNKRGTGLASYLIALTTANPSPTDHWHDTRPDELIYVTDPDTDEPDLRPHHHLDVIRARNGLLPLWREPYSTSAPIRRTFMAAHIDAMIPLYLPIADHFGIAHPSNRSTPNSRLSAVLEAIGSLYLTPAKHVPYCPSPVNAIRKGRPTLRRPRSFIDSSVVHNPPSKWELRF